MNNENAGIIRHIDELGRIVIPKDIRKTLRVREGDPVELTADRDCMHLRRYRPLWNLEETCRLLLDAFGRGCSCACVITDTERIIAGKGITVSSEKHLSAPLSEQIRSGVSYHGKGENAFDLLGGTSHPVASISPVTKDGRAYGAVILLQQGEVASWAYNRSRMLADTLSQILQDGN